MNKFNKTLGKRIKQLRLETGISQELLAQHLNLKRTAVSQIETGNRNLTAAEIIKIAHFFNISADALLEPENDIKVIFEKREPKAQNKPEIRINVPQKNLKKFKEVLLYILNKVGSKPNIGETVLYKLLYFIDFDYYEKYEEQILGATYIKNHHGPTPKEFIKIVKDMEGKDLHKVKDKYYKYPQTKYLPLREPDLSSLTAKEIKLIDQVITNLGEKNATQISEYSHGDVPWIVTEEGKIIEYESVFYRKIQYSVR